MKKQIIYFILLFIISISFVYAEPSEWAIEEINIGVEDGLVPGDLLDDYTTNINRRDFCKMIMHIYIKNKGFDGIDDFLNANKDYTYPFDDLNADNEDDKYIYGANILKIVNGVSNNQFSPDANLTREQASKIIYNLYKMLGGKDVNDSENDFLDDNLISPWAKEYVYKAKSIGLMKGVGEGKFNPLGSYTREQAIITALRVHYEVSYNTLKKELFQLINKKRVELGLLPFDWLKEYSDYSDLRANELMVKFSLERPNGEKSFDNIKNYHTVAESIFGGAKDPYIAFNKLMENPEYISYISNANFEKISIGLAHDKKKNIYYWEQIFYKGYAKEEEKFVKNISLFKKEVLRLTNIEREKNGLSKLEYIYEFDNHANRRASEIVELFAHKRPNGESCFSGIDSYRTLGENIAGGQKSPKDVVEGWMNSKGHRANILNPDFTHLAVGCKYDQKSLYKYYWVQFFYTPPK